MKLFRHIFFTLVWISFSVPLSAQISPGELSQAHAQLEGISNCTQCHTVGSKVTREKCLACHKEIKDNIVAGKGYHASSDVQGKVCSACHNEHHGRTFNIIRFNKDKFDHAKTGFKLQGEHAKQDCKACHKPEFIQNPKLKKKSGTYLGLNQQCTTCHLDFHQGKLPNCTDCHNFNTFKNAKRFDHKKTRFPLLGKHQTVGCVECHKTTGINGKKVQNFAGLKFDNCNACHKDVHNNRLGQNCKECHQESSFHDIKGMSTFDHDRTGYKLVGKHKLVECRECHKTSLTAPLKHAHCTDCHEDYHKKQFAVNGVSPDCNACHSVYGFKPSDFTIERHNKTKFKLENAHAATSCFECHHKGEEWSFRNIGERCVDCHTNVHKDKMDEKFMPNEDCTVCHSTKSWDVPVFDHDKTGFKLEGAHAKEKCNACHYPKDEKGVKNQIFNGLSQKCSACHKDNHVGQFAVNGQTDCTRCHGVDDWHNSKFDHNTSRFKIDGQHVGVKCEACHKTVINKKGTYVEYKFDNIGCSRCHKDLSKL
ncbi:MAG: cytochrome C [Paludibacter sp.]|nr:cytochrome C [Paludibacter sp.]